MELRMKIRQRAPLPTPWKWEIYGEKLITAARASYASKAEAYEAGQAVLARMAGSAGARE
jgi:hypothetical protein